MAIYDWQRWKNNGYDQSNLYNQLQSLLVASKKSELKGGQYIYSLHCLLSVLRSFPKIAHKFVSANVSPKLPINQIVGGEVEQCPSVCLWSPITSRYQHFVSWLWYKVYLLSNCLRPTANNWIDILAVQGSGNKVQGTKGWCSLRGPGFRE